MAFFSTKTQAQVGIGTTAPNADAQLDITSTNRGLLLPRVALTNTTSPAPLTADVAGMIVYNTATAGDVTPGFYYNDGAIWVRLGAGGAASNDWTITGNTGTNATTNFIGTTDAVDVVMRSNNTEHFRVGQNEIAANDNSLDFDFRIESEDVREMFLVDASANEILVNTGGAGTHPYPDDPFVSYTNFVLPSGSTTNSFAITGWNSGDTGGGGNFQNTNAATAFAAMEASTVGTGNAVTGSAFGPAGSTGSGIFGQSSLGNGVRGVTANTTAGTDFDLNNNKGVWGTLSNTDTFGTGNTSRSFGVVGSVGDGGALTNYGRRTGGVLGTDLYARGALGYYAQNNNDYAIYGFSQAHTNGNATGRAHSSGDLDSYIGLGIYGGVMGGWIKGQKYGTVLSGQEFGSYVDGKAITNDTYVVLDKTNGNERTASYASTALTVDVSAKGTGTLNNGIAQINFDQNYQRLIDSKKPIIVTVTPIGESEGIHLVSVGKNGFTVKENRNGNSNTQFTWIAIAEKTTNPTKISSEILANDFDKNIDGVMHNDEVDGGNAIWYQNGQINFGKEAPFNTKKLNVKMNKKDTAKNRESAKK